MRLDATIAPAEAAPSIVFTGWFAASSSGVGIEVIDELAEQMDSKNGRLSMIDSLDETAESVTAFSRSASTVSEISSANAASCS